MQRRHISTSLVGPEERAPMRGAAIFGSPAAVSCGVIQDLGQRLCVPPFQAVCLCRFVSVILEALSQAKCDGVQNITLGAQYRTQSQAFSPPDQVLV